MQKPVGISSKRDKDKENVKQSQCIEILFDVLKGNETDGNNLEEYAFGSEGGDDDDNCVCDTIQGERTCIEIDEEESNAASSGDDFAFCYTYISGVFDNTICEIFGLLADTCTVTIDGTECNSCATTRSRESCLFSMALPRIEPLRYEGERLNH